MFNLSKRLAAAAASLLAVLVCAVPASAAAATPYGTNLLKNPGAEAGAASSNGYATVSIPGWVTYYTPTVVRYGTPGGFPSRAQGSAISGGRNFFAAGLEADHYTCGVTEQWVHLTGRNAAIDSGHVKIVISAYVATFANQSDDAIVGAVAYRKNDYQSGISDVNSAPVTATNGDFVKVKKSMVLPAGTRWILFALREDVHEGDYCDAYFDRTVLKIQRV